MAPLDLRWKDYEMRKGFTRKPKADEPATQGKNYITPSGLQRLQDEHRFLLSRERPAVTEVVAWAASNGDRSENADYQYGKRRLRQIDGRIRFLRKRIEAAEVVDPETPRTGQAATRAFFGATVRYANAAGVERVVSIVGTDEVDLDRNHISWVSPLGRALLKSAAGDSVVLQAPGGTEYLDVLEVCYERISVEPFREPPGSESSSKGLSPTPFQLKRARATTPRNGVTVNYSTSKNNFSLIWGNGLRTPGLGLELTRRHSAQTFSRKSNRAMGKLLLRKKWQVCSQLLGWLPERTRGRW